MSRRARPNKVKKIIKNLKQTFKDGQYYEGEQMLKTIHTRLMNQNDFDQAATLLSAGAMILFEHEQVSAGIEIVNDLIETWMKAGKKIDNEKIDLLAKMYQLIPDNEIESKLSFMHHISEWGKKVKKGEYIDIENKDSNNESKQEQEEQSNDSKLKEKNVLKYYKLNKESIAIDDYLTKLYMLHGISLQNFKLYNLASISFTKSKNVELQIKLCNEWNNEISKKTKKSKSNEYYFLIARMSVQFLVVGAIKQARHFTNEMIEVCTVTSLVIGIIWLSILAQFFIFIFIFYFVFCIFSF